MPATINIIAQPQDALQIEAVKAVLKALKIDFHVSKEPLYNKKFTEKVIQSENEIEQKKTKRVKKEDLKQFLGL
jgi:hypothetical protein